MTTLEELCDFLDLPYTTDIQTVFECVWKYINDDAVRTDLEDRVNDLEVYKEHLEALKIESGREVGYLKNQVIKLETENELLARSFIQSIQGDPDLIDQNVYNTEIINKISKEYE